MIDIHCHPIAGVDDGAETFEVSVAMCQMAAADGITHLVATPHCNDSYKFQPEINRAKIEELQAAVGEVPQLLLGCDFHLSYDNIRQLVEGKGDFTINRTAYVLVEFGNQFIPEQFEQVLYDIQLAGLTPIMTHPERNPVFQRRPELLYQWVARGCLTQVTAQSYVGGFGSKALELAAMWLNRNLIHFFATDAHDLKRRPPILSSCYQKVVAAKGRATGDLLLKQNPEAVIKGLPLPPRPEPVAASKPHPKWNWRSFFRRRA
jgi:protein-tyrosine phosphatase